MRVAAFLGVVALCGLLVWYGFDLLLRGLAYESGSVVASGLLAITYEPTPWGLAPIAFGLVIGIATFVRFWLVVWLAMVVMSAFSFLTGFSIGGPMFLVAMCLWPLVMALALTAPPGEGFVSSMKARRNGSDELAAR